MALSEAARVVIKFLVWAVQTFSGRKTLGEFKHMRAEIDQAFEFLPTWTRLFRACLKDHKVFWRSRRDLPTAGSPAGCTCLRRYHFISDGCSQVLRALRSRK